MGETQDAWWTESENEAQAPARRGWQHARSENVTRMSRRHLAVAAAHYPAAENDDVPRPRTWGECKRLGLGTRENPCPNLLCRHHVALEVHAVNGHLRFNVPFAPSGDGVPEIDLAAMPETCSLRGAERGGMELRIVGECFAITRERVRQIEYRVTRALRDRMPGEYDDYVPADCAAEAWVEPESCTEDFVPASSRASRTPNAGSKR